MMWRDRLCILQHKYKQQRGWRLNTVHFVHMNLGMDLYIFRLYTQGSLHSLDWWHIPDDNLVDFQGIQENKNKRLDRLCFCI